MKGKRLKLQQKTNDDQDNNSDGQHIYETTRMCNIGKYRLTKETEKPVRGQDQDDQRKQGNLLLRRTPTTRPENRPDGSIMNMPAARARMRPAGQAANGKVIFTLSLIPMLLQAGIRNFGLPFYWLLRLQIHCLIVQPLVPLYSFLHPV